MNPIQAFRLFRYYEKAQDILKEKVTPMKKAIQIIHLLATAAAVIGVPTMDEKWLRNPEHAGIFGLLLAISALLHAVSPSVFGAPPTTQPPDNGGGNVLGKAAILLLGLLLIPATLKAQTITPAVTPIASAPAPTSLGLAAESDAMAVHFNGEWSAGTLVTESFDFLDFGATKGNHLFVTGQQFLAPTPGVQAYLGGITVQPDFSTLLKKTNVPVGNFSAFFGGSVGNGIPAVGGSHISFLAGGGVKYSVTSNLTWQTIQGYYGRIGSQPFEVISTGLSFIFGRPGQ